MGWGFSGRHIVKALSDFFAMIEYIEEGDN